MRTLSRSEARDRAEELATPLSDLIRPNEVTDGADEWSDVDPDDLEFHVHESVRISLSERQDHKVMSVLYDRAITHYLDECQRVPMKHLSDDIERTEALVSYGYWPYKMSRGEAYCSLAERWETLRDVPTEDYQEAYDAVSAGLADGMVPAGAQLP
jgi:hypothetical protein